MEEHTMGFDWDAYIGAWNAHAWETADQYMTATAIYEDRALGIRVQGLDAIRGYLSMSARTFSSDSTLDLTDRFETADHFALEWTMRGTHDGSSPQLPATGRRFEIRGVTVGRLEHGLVAESHDYWDVAGFLAQVGLMPQPAAAGAH
jgi:steroid delta-isomerase-like uncharacterized protein